ncbi:MAG TPA: hypothetical protein VFE17_06330 [Candidatus Baltobacteraceae bacterium]|nr:hypothetical protein [Candidatus Baltobacteraceae bacterium]
MLAVTVVKKGSTGATTRPLRRNAGWYERSVVPLTTTLNAIALTGNIMG